MLETGLYLWGSLDYVPCLTGHSTSANPYYQLWILKLSLLNKSAYYKIHILDNHFDFCCSFSSGFLFVLGQPLQYPLLEHIWKLDFYLKWNKFTSLQLSTVNWTGKSKDCKRYFKLIWKLNPVLIELLIKSKLRSIDSYDIV